jgi:hypothetical protein
MNLWVKATKFFFFVLERLLWRWEFNYLYSRGRLGGLIIGWRARVLSWSNIFSFDLGLGIVLFFHKMGK